ncbi:hypothetical protein [Eleftheria terrae]|uniref:hypothetical protein n=1 Tax=Eleftheria terrae TaxID=1597781 RepID=UPI00263B4EF3|nr:hypothetical protein [Eleftheria terrae]WKB55963.1 hypothetical protein N7L95_28235 [Eleftheria terrae]
MTLRVRPYPARAGLRDYVDFASDPTCAETLLYRVDSRHGPLTLDMDAGMAHGHVPGDIPGGPQLFITGAGRSVAVGKDVVINCTTTDKVTLVVETSVDGTNWSGPTGPGSRCYSLNSGDSIGIRFTAVSTLYRCRLDAITGGSVRKATVTSQVRDPGV